MEAPDSISKWKRLQLPLEGTSIQEVTVKPQGSGRKSKAQRLPTKGYTDTLNMALDNQYWLNQGLIDLAFTYLTSSAVRNRTLRYVRGRWGAPAAYAIV